MPRPAKPHPYHKWTTRWLDSQDKSVPPGTRGAKKVQTQTNTYYADIPGVGTVALGTTDLQVAWKRLRDRLQQAHQTELGIRDTTSQHGTIPLRQHLEQWLEILEAKGTGEKQRRLLKTRLTILFDLAKWQRLADITADSALLALKKLERTPRLKGPGRGAQTRAHYITHLKGFCNWCVESDRLPKNPVRRLDKPRVETDQRHQRREPTREEVAALLEYLESGHAKVRRRMSGLQRALAYKVAMATGFRANELRRLRRESFNLEAGTVTLPAKEEKARRGAVQPLPAWLVLELHEWFVAGGGTWETFGAIPGRVLHADLDAARAAWISSAPKGERAKRAQSTFLCYEIEGADGPLFVDMHALRVYYISELAADPNMDIKTLMRLARHRRPEMSLSVYAKHREANVRAAAERLRNPGKQ